ANFNSATVSVFLGNGNGTFAAKQDFSTGSMPRSVAVADVNGDGKPDLAGANNVSNTVSVLLGSGNGSLAAKGDFTTGNIPLSLAVADVNGDGKLDLAVANFNSSTVSVLLGNGNGVLGASGSANFAAKQDFATGTTPFSVAVADVSGDGKVDL